MPAKKVNLISLCLRFVVGFSWLSFWSLIAIGLMILCLPFRNLRIRLGNLTGKIVGPVITRITGTKLIYSNRSKINETRPAIYVMNHASSLDILGSSPEARCTASVIAAAASSEDLAGVIGRGR